MPKGYEPGGLTMSEIMRVMGELEKETDLVCSVEMGLKHAGPDVGKLALVVKLSRPTTEARKGVQYTASMPWPTNSHKTVLGALYWLLIDAGSQSAAGDALEHLGA